MSRRSEDAIERAFASGMPFVLSLHKTVHSIAGEVIFTKSKDPEQAARWDLWLDSLTEEDYQIAARLAEDWHGTPDDLITAVEELK